MSATEHDHLQRAVELIEMATAVAKDESMPAVERAVELRRLAGRIDSHATSAEFIAEINGSLGV